MKTTLYYFTGSGNSLWVARTLAEKMENTSLVPMAKVDDVVKLSAGERMGLVFPIHMWGCPPLVNRFVSRINAADDGRIFAVAVCAGALAASLKALRRRVTKKGLVLTAGFSVAMPSIYLPFGDIPEEEKLKDIFSKAEVKIGQIAEALENGENMPVEKGPHWQNIVFSMLNALIIGQVPKLDRSFSADEKCTACGVCVKVCPVNNIELKEGKPVWLNHCEQCFACLHWCPEEAIQFGKSTVGKKRYHHPEIILSDMTGDV